MAVGRDCPLLRTYWKSVNYQWKDEKIVFFAEDSEAQAVQGVTCPDRVISSQAVVIHGCKDGSLHKMAIAGFPMPEDKPVMPSDSTGLDIPSKSMGLEGVGQNVPVLSISDQQPAPTPKKMRPTVAKRQKPAKKKRTLSPEERQRRSDAMKEILARKAERKAQGVV